jgi:hypothetical protein
VTGLTAANLVVDLLGQGQPAKILPGPLPFSDEVPVLGWSEPNW